MRKYFFNFVFIIFLFSCINRNNEKTVVLFTANELDIINKIIRTINQESQQPPPKVVTCREAPKRGRLVISGLRPAARPLPDT
jgi:hypothetical protein